MAAATQSSSQLQPTNTFDTSTNADSDWEYEYDENETEDIYFTLDLTTHVPNAIQEKQYAKNGRLIAPAAPEKNATESGAAPATNGQGELDDADNPQDDNTADATPPAEAGKLQILDLHTEKPYVKFNNGFYSCYWFTDLGTQFWITNPGVVSDPKLSGHVLDVVGSSQTRLVAKPANLKRKRDVPDPEPAAAQLTTTQPVEIEDDAAAPSDVSDAEGPSHVFDVPHDPTVPMVIPRQKIKDPHLEAQANFMERLSALKLKKGEHDAHKIPMKVPVYYKGAHNADELRASHAGNGNPDEPQQQQTPKPLATGDDAEEGAPTTETTPAPLPSRVGKRARGNARGGARGGAPSHAARRSNLGLELMGENPAPKKRGRKSNAEKALLAEQAAAAAGAAAANHPEPFALDPLLGGQAQAQAGAEEVEGEVTTTPQAAASREVSLAASSTQGEFQPRKRRRTKAQMEEARRLDEERKAKLAAAKAEKARRRESGDAAKSGGGPEAFMAAADAAGHGQGQERPARRTRASLLAAGLDGGGGEGEVGLDGGGDEKVQQQEQEPAIDPELDDMDIRGSEE